MRCCLPTDRPMAMEAISLDSSIAKKFYHFQFELDAVVIFPYTRSFPFYFFPEDLSFGQ